MRILYITPFVPWPVRVRSYNFIPRLSVRHQVHLLALSRSAEEAARAGYVAPYCASMRVCRHHTAAGLVSAALALPTSRTLREAFFASRAMRAAAAEEVARLQPDVVLVERWRALQYVPPRCAVPVVCDATDSMTLYNGRLMRSGTAWERLLAAEEYWKFCRREPLLVMRTAAAVFCSGDDICAAGGAPNCYRISNGVDLDVFHRRTAADGDPLPTILFWGNLGYRPNRHAVEFFLREVFPHVARVFPEVRFAVVGNGASKVLRYYRSHPQLAVSDFLPDLQPAIARATVAVAPMTVGSGTSNKILQALAVGTPMVATPLACGDLPVTPGRHLLVAGAPREFADSIVRLLRDPGLRSALAANGRLLAAQCFDWDIVARELEDLLLRCSTSAPLRDALAEVV